MTDKPIRAWQLTMIFNRRRLPDIQSRFADFVATDAVDAAPKVLAILQKHARRFHDRRGMYVIDLAAPHGFDTAKRVNFLQGDEMLRLKDGLNNLNELLRLKNPMKAFTVGYGKTRKHLDECVPASVA